MIECGWPCLSASEVGIDGYPGVVAVAHPDCPVHGEKED